MGLETPIASIVSLSAISIVGAIVSMDVVKAWIVFILCLLFSALGVGASFMILGSGTENRAAWIAGSVIAVVMLGVTYGAKYASASSRKEFTPVDLIQYTSQGFLWPSAWPSLAEALGVRMIEPPQTSFLLNELIWSATAFA